MIRSVSLSLLTTTILGWFHNPAPAANIPGAGFTVASYSLALTPDIQNKTVLGRESITLRANVDGVRRLNFSANALIIDRATLDGVALAHTVEGDALGFDLLRPLRRGRTVRLELHYHGRPARGFVGSSTTLYTSYFACDWMFCSEDKFGEKAAFSLDLRVPAGVSSLSVGSLIARRSGPDGSEIHSWKAPRPYSVYLYGFAMGRFTHASEWAGSKKLTYISDTTDSAELKRRFAGTREMVAFLSLKAGMPLPVSEYRQLLVDGGEAQEAATYSVLGTESLPTKPNDSSEDWAIVHELTHQWWGNLITCETLKDFWLNEGITTFMTAAWKEHRYGRVAYDAELDVAKSRLKRAQVKGFDKPLAWNGIYPTLGVRRAIQYSKGALFMAQLRVTLGDTAFWSGLRRYTRDHAGGTVTSIDLERAMEASSGQDLQQLFAEWVFGDEISD
ncbi:M1 family aminopeptidase [Sphingomonas faeni]|uniref:M1 family aminopeptidase n=1 Tax=Sphingomonas faeni TaxID=185950 RepID=UPI002412F757|nr:M1 family aminopeptidase [Sphingomonas faeni]